MCWVWGISRLSMLYNIARLPTTLIVLLLQSRRHSTSSDVKHLISASSLCKMRWRRMG
ncbi:hypothetical protein JG688_00010975 [Phytophthora aleatoria]|uniref:Uncharacterized protein n=1 Tax=Phytophthora aleatoria TaxID=2496075 RepID=A0A8J5INW7_9STRA|nr:hypothetical protein JG688_00010975 [Phytophthora aleatoria]